MSMRTTTSRRLALAISAALLTLASSGYPQDAGSEPGPSAPEPRINLGSGVAPSSEPGPSGDPRSGVAEAKTFHIYYLGGQSNMDGFGTIAELPADLNQPVEGIYIYHGNTAPDGAGDGVQPGQHPGAQPDAQPGAQPGAGRWSIIKPGHGVGFRSDGEANTYSDRFGVELTFARRIAALHPDRNIAIIKYSRGGTSISRAARSASRAGCWDPDFDPAVPNQLDHAVATIKAALAAGDIDGDGSADTLIPAGIVWMQGESDGADRGPAQDYGENLRRVMDALSEALGDSAHELPVAIGLISDSGRQPQAGEDGKIWDFGEHVRLAQADYCDIEARAVLVDSTDEYGYSDPYHYDTAGYIDLGRKFAEAIAGLEKKGP